MTSFLPGVLLGSSQLPFGGCAVGEGTRQKRTELVLVIQQDMQIAMAHEIWHI